ncbi:MAG TPA: ATP-binding protein [Candidatus Polarisedimenticolia bacterium]|nr:ATP-binding protein [Candidatus Polarisedimenticolia bacterium]
MATNALIERPARELVAQVCREIAQIVPCDQIFLALPSGDGTRFEAQSLHSMSDQTSAWELASPGSCAAYVIKRGKSEVFANLGSEFRYPEEEILHRLGIRDAAFLPLRSGATALGVLILGSKEPRALDEKGIRMLERASGLLALALTSARQEGEAGPRVSAPAPPAGAATPGDGLQRAYREMVAYSRVANRIVQEDDLNAACRLFLEAIREHSGYRRAVLTLLDAQSREFQWFFTGATDDDIDHFHAHKMTPEQRESLFKESHRIGNSFCLPTTEVPNHGGLPARRTRQGAEGAKSECGILFIPLYGAGATLVGTVMLDDPAVPATPTAEGLSSLELFAGQVAHAIEKKRLDQAVKSAQARLRTAQEQLMQAEKMSAIGQLISGVTHELNNPLSGVMGFAQLLLQSETNPKVRKNLERINNEAVRCQKIVQNLLSFSRRHRPEKVHRSLSEAIDSVLELRHYQLQVDDVEVERRYAADLPKTMFDFHQIQQVILNVVNNAHQAMMETTGRPRRLLVTTERHDNTLRVRFTDSGAGIPRDRLEKIFDPFFTTKGDGKGTGLGLSLARAIIRDHQGTMSAESVLGEGTTIQIDLPLLGENAQPAPREEPKGDPPAPPKSLRILVVDDEAILVELLSDFLKSVGHDVDQAHDGRSALDLAKANDYDAVLSDLKMPGLDGQGFYEQIVKLKPAMASRFIFATGDLANPKVQTFFQATGCLYLSKPFKLDAVLSVLDQLVRRQQAA